MLKCTHNNLWMYNYQSYKVHVYLCCCIKQVLIGSSAFFTIKIHWKILIHNTSNQNQHTLQLLCAFQMYSRDDSAINEENRPIKCESSPPTPRSLRLERGSGSHNTSAEDTPRSVSPCRATYGLIQRLACTCEGKMFGDFILL